jgi:hypothetical protein
MKILTPVVLLFLLFTSSLPSEAQSYVFGAKAGPLLANQQWEGFQRDPLIDFHALMFIESWSEDNDGSLFAQLGYHRRGSALRNIAWNSDLGFRPSGRAFRFNNIVLTLGAKKVFSESNLFRTFYAIGVRGEYTLNTNLDEYSFSNPNFFTFYPQDAFVMHWNYGLYGAVGFEFDLSDLIGLQLDISINPDLSRQYFQPPINNVTVITPNGGTMQTNISERVVRNQTLEISLGFRFLRKVEYVD